MPGVVRLLTIVACLSLSLSATAGLVRITPPGVSPDEQAITSPVPIDGDGFRLTLHGGGNKTLIDPILLIIGTPADSAAGDSGAPALSYSGVGSKPGYDASLLVTLGSNAWGASTTGSEGIFDAASPVNDVYELIGVDLPNSGGGDSQNYTNWSGAAASNTGAESWEIFVYEINFSPEEFGAGDFLEFSTDLALDSFVAGYGCLGDSGTSCRKVDATPFT